MSQYIILAAKTPTYTVTDQFIVLTVTVAVGGQKEKNQPTMLYAIEIRVIGTPKRPSLKGPHRISEAGVVNRFHNMTEAATVNDE